MEQLKGDGEFSYSEDVVTFKWPDLCVKLFQLNEEEGVCRQVSLLMDILRRKKEFSGKQLSDSLVERIGRTKSVFGVEVSPSVDERANDIVCTVCFNISGLVLSGDMLYDKDMSFIV
ncbi:hypothetical protein [Marinobacter xestospongiae]|uniref:Uncharacterized protein n=1 Tax=Marinobacter xestospongiae TaxID=994319 RepID=A0ABU3VXE0_9GAMM|nr:hypothetical protein [Marinobacter xestospongiae]MDV2078911.1 hypothetical protein [Marinobacter xestospongiae]